MSEFEHHAASVLIESSAATVFGFVASPENLGKWAFDRAQVDNGLASGLSRFGRQPVFARIDADPDRHIVEFHVGSDPQKLSPRIVAKIVPGPLLDREEGQSALTLLAWRTVTMPDLRWRQLKSAHEIEVLLLKDLIEDIS